MGVRYFLKVSAQHPWTIVAVLAVITAVLAAQMPKLHVQISAESMLDKQTPAWQRYTDAERTFGSEDGTILVISDPDLFAPDKLTAIRDVIRRIVALPVVDRATSLFNVPNLKNVDGFVNTRPYLQPLPGSPDEVASMLDDARRNPLVSGNLVAAESNTMAINVSFNRDTRQPGFDKTVTEQIERLIDPLRARLDEVFQIGLSAMRSDLTDKIRSDQRIYLPLSVIVLLTALALMLRRANAALIPLCTAGLSVIWTLGFLGAVGIPLNIMTSIVPALVIIIGSTEDIHLLTEYAAGIDQGLRRRDAVVRMADKMGMAVLLTFITTYLGFLSIALNDIELLFQFGITASTGLLFNFLITVSLVPVMLHRFGHRDSVVATGTKRSSTLFQRWAVGLMLRLRRRRGQVFAMAALLALLSFLAATHLRINNNFLDYLDRHSALRSHTDRIHETLSGVHSFSIVLASGIENTFLQTRYLAEISKLQGFIGDLEVFDRSFSFADFVVQLNSAMASDAEPMMQLPESDEVLREYMLFVKHDDIAAYVSPAFDQAQIVVRHNITSSERLNQAVAALQTRIDEEIDPALKVEITGMSILSNQAIEQMALGQLQSLLLVSAVIVGLVSLLFVSIRAGLIALVPNLFPVVVLFGVMGIADIPLNAGTSMVAAIALGICVDDTMHVMSRFHEELKVHASRRAALIAMLKAEAQPIFATSIALAAGFMVFATSSFQPVVHFGVLSAMVMLVALAATFILTPLLLSTSELLTVWDLLSCKIQNIAVRESPLFAGMYIWQIKKLLLASEIRRYPVGSRIIEEGAEGSEMYLVLDGAVEARKTHHDGRTDRLRAMGVGELFGEVAPLSGCRRTADVVAVADTRTLVLSWSRIDRLTHRYPVLAFRLFRNLTAIIGARLTQTSEYQIAAARSSTSGQDDGR